MKRIVLFIVTASLFLPTSTAYAVENPLSAPNNKFGIHIIDEHDLTEASELVNSNGGEWGYVTLVIREDERNKDRWQKVFNKMQELKLIPIVRLATKMEGNGWSSPKPEEAREWAEFLGSLDWVVKNRYIILFNEPNHAKEWGNTLAPEEYARVARAFWEQLKRQSTDFFVLPAGFDAAAPDSTETLNEVTYWEKMYQEDTLIFTIFDGWTSHSYPNPGFSGSPFDTGKTSIRGFEWEVNYLKKYGVQENSPIFITETGWVHTGNLNDLQELSEKYRLAYEQAWNDSRIVAVTPFVLSYLAPPFDTFTWKAPETGEDLPHFAMVQGIQKIRGEPISTIKPSPTPIVNIPSPAPTPQSVDPVYEDKPILQQVIELLTQVTGRIFEG